MTTSMEKYLKSLPSLQPEEIPQAVLGYLRSRIKNEAHQSVLREYERLSAEGKITKALIAKRLGKDPAQINRCLGSAGNWTLDTYADLLGAMGVSAHMDTTVLDTAAPANWCHAEYNVHNFIYSTYPENTSSADLAEPSTSESLLQNYTDTIETIFAIAAE